MNCENIILEVLKEAGDTGLPVSKITHHVYNASNSLFHDIAWDDVKSYVSTFLLKQSRNPNSLIEKTEKRGYYALKIKNTDDSQLLFQFSNHEEPKDKEDSDYSSSLFLDM